MDIEAETTTNPVNKGDTPRRFSHSTTVFCSQMFPGKAPEPTDLPIFSDESTPLYSIYNETAQKDQTMAEIWQDDINSSLVVVRYRLDHTILVLINHHRLVSSRSW